MIFKVPNQLPYIGFVKLSHFQFRTHATFHKSKQNRFPVISAFPLEFSSKKEGFRIFCFFHIICKMLFDVLPDGTLRLVAEEDVEIEHEFATLDDVKEMMAASPWTEVLIL